jgi:hypothetical protein
MLRKVLQNRKAGEALQRNFAVFHKDKPDAGQSQVDLMTNSGKVD